MNNKCEIEGKKLDRKENETKKKKKKRSWSYINNDH